MFSTASTLVFWALIIASTAAGVVQLVRLLPWVQTAMLAGKKPWVCNLCMSWWTTISLTAIWSLLEHAPPLAEAPAFALTLLLVNALGAPQTKPEFDLEEIPEIEEPKP